MGCLKPIWINDYTLNCFNEAIQFMTLCVLQVQILNLLVKRQFEESNLKKKVQFAGLSSDPYICKFAHRVTQAAHRAFFLCLLTFSLKAFKNLNFDCIMLNFAIIIAHDRAQKYVKVVKSLCAHSRTVALRCHFFLLSPDNLTKYILLKVTFIS